MRLAVAAGLILTASTAAAAECDYRGSDEILAPVEWRTEGDTITLTFENLSGNHIILIDADAVIYDALGNSAGAIIIIPDLDLPAGATHSQTTRHRTGSRLLSIDPGRTTVSLCAAAVQYEDGTVERFD